MICSVPDQHQWVCVLRQAAGRRGVPGENARWVPNDCRPAGGPGQQCRTGSRVFPPRQWLRRSESSRRARQAGFPQRDCRWAPGHDCGHLGEHVCQGRGLGTRGWTWRKGIKTVCIFLCKRNMFRKLKTKVIFFKVLFCRFGEMAPSLAKINPKHQRWTFETWVQNVS